MKKILVLSFVALVFSLSGYSQSIDKIVDAFKAEKAAEHQLVDNQMLSMMKSQKDSTSDKKSMDDIMKKINQIDVYTVKNQNGTNTNAISKAMDDYKDGDNYETIVNVNNKNDHVKIVSHTTNNIIDNVYILVHDDESIVYVNMSGSFTPDDLQAIIKDQSKNLINK